MARPLPDPSMDKYTEQLEQRAIRAALPRGLQDDKAKELKYQLHWCLSKNDWYFTAGRHVCAEHEQAYKEYKKQLVEQYRKQAEDIKQQLREARH